MTPRLPISAERRARNLRRLMSLGSSRHRQLLERLGLGGAQEGEELGHIERLGAVVVLRAAGEIASAAVASGFSGDSPGVTAKPSTPVMCRMMSVSRPFSLVSVVMPRPPRRRFDLIAGRRCRRAQTLRMRLRRADAQPPRAHRACRSLRRRRGGCGIRGGVRSRAQGGRWQSVIAAVSVSRCPTIACCSSVRRERRI